MMPKGKGTYDSKVGRPPKNKNNGNTTAKNTKNNKNKKA